MEEPKSNIPTITSVLNIKNMVCNCCIRVLKEDFEKAGVLVKKVKLGEVEISYNPDKINFNQIEKIINDNRFELVTDKEKILVEQIKLAVIELIHYYNNANSLIRNSDYLIEKLGYTYQYLSCLPHFFGTPSETLDITTKLFILGCPEMSSVDYQ